MNCYQEQLELLAARGLSDESCSARLTETYLDGKPRKQGKRSITQRERDRQFWSLDFWRTCSLEIWKTQNFELSLSRYMAQEAVAAPDLLNLIAQSTPEVVHRAARHSRLVLNPTSPRRSELEAAASLNPVIHELCQVLLIFEKAHWASPSFPDGLPSLLSLASASNSLVSPAFTIWSHKATLACGNLASGTDQSAPL